MAKHFFSYVRVSVCSLSAVAVASCAKFSGNLDHASVEPNRSDAPEDLLNAHLDRGRIDWEEQRIDELESQLQSVNYELRGLRKALELLGPLEGSALLGDQLLDPVDPVSVMAHAPDAGPLQLVSHTAHHSEQPFDISSVFADPPSLKGGQSIFHGVMLADYPTRGAAEADWGRLSHELGLEGLEPRFEDLGDGVRMFAGPFKNRESAVGICGDLAPAAGHCEPSAFQGVLN